MNLKKITGALLALALPLSSMAEDIDLFVGVPPADNPKSNVLIILDNTANWNTAFENEKDALEDLFNGLGEDRANFNVGLMLFGQSTDVGYVRAAIRPMDVEVVAPSAGNPDGVYYNNLYADMIGSFGVSTGTGDGGAPRTLARTFSEAYQYLNGLESIEPNSETGTGKNVFRDYTQNTAGSPETDIVHALPDNAFEALVNPELEFTYNEPPDAGANRGRHCS